MYENEKVRLIIEKLMARRPLLPLSPSGAIDPALDEAIGELAKDAGIGAGADEDVLAVISGLYLWNGNLDRSHTISQDIDNATGSYWHGIMHRMEGDYWNAKYWFRRVGLHPAMQRLQAEAGSVLTGKRLDGLADTAAAMQLRAMSRAARWDAAAFVDAVEAQQTGRGCGQAEALLQELQHLELSVLAAYCAELAAPER